MRRPRIFLAQSMLRVGSLLRSLALMVMRPDDLIEFSRRSYARSDSISGWSGLPLLHEGLNSTETQLLQKCPLRSGKLLLLGVGGGREAIPLVKNGFQVTGVDFIPGMAEHARANLAREGLALEVLVQDISRLEVPPAGFDLVWFSPRMYSLVPTRPRRIALLKRIALGLRSNGVLVCQFHWDRRYRLSSRNRRLHRMVALLTLGYRQFEPGDMLWSHQEFLHAFDNESSLRDEFAEGGFDVLFLELNDENMMGGAVLQKGSRTS